MTPGQKAYTAYVLAFPGHAKALAFPWAKLPLEIQQAWEAAGRAARWP